MLGSHLDGLRSCLGDGHLSLASMKVDEHCIISDAHIGMCGMVFFVTFFFLQQYTKECRHQHVQWVEMGGVQDFDIALKGRPGEVGR